MWGTQFIAKGKLEPCAHLICVVGACELLFEPWCANPGAGDVMPERESGTTATAPSGAQPLSGPASGGPAAGAAQGDLAVHSFKKQKTICVLAIFGYIVMPCTATRMPLLSVDHSVS